MTLCRCTWRGKHRSCVLTGGWEEHSGPSEGFCTSQSVKTNEDKYFFCRAEQMHGALNTAEWCKARLTGFRNKKGKKIKLGCFCMPAPINWVMNSDKLKWPFECNKTLSTRRRSVFLHFLFLFFSLSWLPCKLRSKKTSGVLHLTKSSCRYAAWWLSQRATAELQRPELLPYI